MIGYKAFDSELKCRGFQFEVGKTYTKDTKKEEMELCTDKVFHFCRELYEIERNSDYILANSRLCEVISGEDVIGEEGKFGTNKLTILREIVGDEKCNLINSGDYNSGDYNSGYRNSGYRNSGDYNSGDYNSGNRNSGNRNSGNYNSGDYNSGDYNSGYLNSTDAPLRMFNKETDVKREDVNFPNFFYFSLTQFVSYDTATDAERETHKKEIETCGGFLKTIGYKEAWRKSWDNADDEDRRKVLKLPNWDNAVFFEITGIDVEKELGMINNLKAKKMEKRNYQAELNAAYRQLNETEKERDEKILKLRGGKVRKISEINMKIAHLRPHWWNNHAARIVEMETERMNVKLDFESQINTTYHFYEDRLVEIRERIISIKQERFHVENQPKQPADGDTIDA